MADVVVGDMVQTRQFPPKLGQVPFPTLPSRPPYLFFPTPLPPHLPPPPLPLEVGLLNPFPPLPFPPLPLEVGPLNPARGSGGAL